MKAELIARFRDIAADGTGIELVVRKVPEPVAPSAHVDKYRWCTWKVATVWSASATSAATHPTELSSYPISYFEWPEESGQVSVGQHPDGCVDVLYTRAGTDARPSNNPLFI